MSKQAISFFKPSIGDDEIAEVVDCLKSGWLTTAGRTKQFETDFAAYMGAEHAVALNSCTAALHLALEAVGVRENDLVLVPTLTFAATAEVVRYFNAVPVLVDSHADDFCLDLDQAEDIIARINRGEPVKGVPEKHNGFKAIIPVHYGGQIADVLRCRQICDRHGLFLIEDCAHCCPARYRGSDGEWKMVGESADIACYSFYANKTITTGEGGMALTNNSEWADRMRVMSLHGISKDAWKRFSKSGSWYYEIVAPGYKYNMTDIAAALGIHQLRRADEFMVERRRVAESYMEKLRHVPGLTMPVEKSDREHSWHLFVVRIDAAITGVHRDQVIDRLKNEFDIVCSVHYTPLHRHPYYRERYGFEKGDFPVADQMFEEIVSLPIYPAMTDQQVEYVTDCLKRIIVPSGSTQR